MRSVIKYQINGVLKDFLYSTKYIIFKYFTAGFLNTLKRNSFLFIFWWLKKTKGWLLQMKRRRTQQPPAMINWILLINECGSRSFHRRPPVKPVVKPDVNVTISGHLPYLFSWGGRIFAYCGKILAKRKKKTPYSFLYESCGILLYFRYRSCSTTKWPSRITFDRSDSRWLFVTKAIVDDRFLSHLEVI